MLNILKSLKLFDKITIVIGYLSTSRRIKSNAKEQKAVTIMRYHNYLQLI